MKRIAFMALLVCLMTGCHTFNSKGEMKFTFEHPERYQMGDDVALEQPVNEIDVSWVSGEINIVYADIPGVRIHEESANELNDTTRMRYYVDDEGSLKIQFCMSGMKYNPQKTKDLSGIEKNLTIEVPRGTVLNDIDMDLVGSVVTIDSVISRELNVDGVIFGITTFYPTLPNEINIDGVEGSLSLFTPATEGMTIEMRGIKKYLNITSERPTRKEGKKTILGDGRCKIEIDGVNCTLNINE